MDSQDDRDVYAAHNPILHNLNEAVAGNFEKAAREAEIVQVPNPNPKPSTLSPTPSTEP